MRSCFEFFINTKVWKLSVESQTNGGREFILRALPEFSELEAGATLKCHFVARQNGDAVPYGMYYIEGKICLPRGNVRQQTKGHNDIISFKQRKN